MLKKFTAALTAILCMMTTVSCTEKNNSQPEKSSSQPEKTADVGDMNVTFFDVGKADSILIRTEKSTVIIDCGEKGDGKEIVAELQQQEVTAVDYLIITHYDKDHVGGAAKVINNLDVKNVLAPDYEENSDEVEKYQKALDAKGITPQILTSDLSFTLDNVEYTVYAPKKTFYGEENDNDFSLVTKAVHGNNTLLFTGDAMEQRLNEIMDIGKCTLLKVPYHGRKLPNLEEFLDSVSPEVAVVCTDQSEFSSDTQSMLISKKISYYATCFNGRIDAVSNGTNISVTAEKGV